MRPSDYQISQAECTRANPSVFWPRVARVRRPESGRAETDLARPRAWQLDSPKHDDRRRWQWPRTRPDVPRTEIKGAKSKAREKGNAGDGRLAWKQHSVI
jgi:hypothetical protein